MTDFWRGRSVLVTGHTGFKGTWLCLWLQSLGAKVSGIALPPDANPNLYVLAGPWNGQDHAVIDIRDRAALRAAVERVQPQTVFHLAAQALVRASYREPVETFAANVMGTIHLLDAVRATPSVETVVAITTDKVYENDSRGRSFVETDRLGGKDPYSNSKACAELAVQSFRDSFWTAGKGPVVATARAGNVVGGGDWSDDRLVPDVVRALSAGKSVSLRYPNSTRPWQHALEPLRGYLMLAERLSTDPASAPKAVNFGPDPASVLTVAQVVEILGLAFGGGVGWEQAPGQHPEAAALSLDSALAKRTLGWYPQLSIEETIGWTADWYRAWRNGANARQLTLDQINAYEALCKKERRV